MATVSAVALTLIGLLLLAVSHRANWRTLQLQRVRQGHVRLGGLAAVALGLAVFAVSKGAEIGITHWLLWSGVGAVGASLAVGQLGRRTWVLLPMMGAFLVLAAILDVS